MIIFSSDTWYSPKVGFLCSLVVICWEMADLLAVVYVVFCHSPKCVLAHIRIKGEVGAVKLV